MSKASKSKLYAEWIQGHSEMGWSNLELVAGLMSETGATQAAATDAVMLHQSNRA